MAYKKGQDRRQRVLFPDCIDEYVEADAPVRCVSSVALLLRLALRDMTLAIYLNSIFTVTSTKCVPPANLPVSASVT